MTSKFATAYRIQASLQHPGSPAAVGHRGVCAPSLADTNMDPHPKAPAATSFQLTGKKKHLQPLSVQGASERKDSSQSVSAFKGGRLQDADGRPAVAGGKLIIPKQQDTFQAGPKRHDPARYLPERGDAVPANNEERFEQAAAEPEIKVDYGLQQRQRPSQQQGPTAAGPGARPYELDSGRFKNDLTKLPEMANAEKYAAMPIENFGEAMLRGMGWTEGRAVCKREKEEVKAAMPVSRPTGLGLGAKPALAESKPKRITKPGDTPVPKQDLVYIDSSGRERSRRPLDAQLTQRQAAGPQRDKHMQIIAGTHEGLACKVEALKPVIEGRSAKASVYLLDSHQTVTVRCEDLAERWEVLPNHSQQPQQQHASSSAAMNGHRASSSTDQRAFQRSSHSPKRVATDEPASQAVANGSSHKRSKSSHGSKQEAGPEQPKPSSSQQDPPWLAEHIMVKVIDKHLGRGRLYLQKAEIINVQAPTICSIHFTATNETVDNVQQDQLETVVPRKEGSRVLILTGASKGQKAWLLQRNSNSGAAAVRPTMDPDTILRLAFDSISEYVGAMGEEE